MWVSITLRWHRYFRLENTKKFYDEKKMFQSPYGGIGTSDVISIQYLALDLEAFQSPYGGIGASD